MKRLKYACIALMLGLAFGCSLPSNNPSPSNTSADSIAEITIQDFAGRSASFNKAPNKIAVLSNGDLDIIYALGASVVGRPSSAGALSVPEAADAEQIGTTHGIDLEKIALIAPDVVIGHHPLNSKDIAAVESIGAKLILTSANSIEDIKRQIQLYGQLLQREDEASEVTRSIEDKVKELSTPSLIDKPRVLLVYGAPGTYMAALDNSLSGDILRLAGGINIASDYPKLEQYPQYAQLNTEKIILANPDHIMLMSHGDPETVKEGFVKEMEQNPAWNKLDAVINGQIEVLPSDLFGTNPGTRVIEALELMADRLQTVN